MTWHFANIFNQNLAKRWKDIALRFVLPINFFFSVSKSGLRWLLKVVTTGRKYSWVYFCNACWKILMNHVIRHKLCKTFNVPFGKPIFRHLLANFHKNVHTPYVQWVSFTHSVTFIFKGNVVLQICKLTFALSANVRTYDCNTLKYLIS